MRDNRSYARFLLAYRLETPDSPGTAPTARGWVVRVPDEHEPPLPEGPGPRWFKSLGEVEGLLRALLDEQGMRDSAERGTAR